VKKPAQPTWLIFSVPSGRRGWVYDLWMAGACRAHTLRAARAAWLDYDSAQYKDLEPKFDSTNSWPTE
jgi:hypothetical protein